MYIYRRRQRLSDPEIAGIVIGAVVVAAAVIAGAIYAHKRRKRFLHRNDVPRRPEQRF